MRLLAQRDDLLTRVPCERKADCDIVTAKPRRNGCDHECGKDEDAPIKGSAHMPANDQRSHAGPETPAPPRDGLPALADAGCWAKGWPVSQALSMRLMVTIPAYQYGVVCAHENRF